MGVVILVKFRIEENEEYIETYDKHVCSHG